MIRPATAGDLPAIEAIYNAIHDKEEAGPVYTNWQRGKYPTYDTASTPTLLLNKGEQVQVGAYNDTWACVRVDGVTGFVPLSALRLAEP